MATIYVTDDKVRKRFYELELQIGWLKNIFFILMLFNGLGILRLISAYMEHFFGEKTLSSLIADNVTWFSFVALTIVVIISIRKKDNEYQDIAEKYKEKPIIEWLVSIALASHTIKVPTPEQIV